MFLVRCFFFGFGQLQKRVKIGGGSGLAKASNASVVELGLLLYQLGSGCKLVYGLGPDAFKQAKYRALSNINAVTRTLGASFTIVVKRCLNFAVSSSWNETQSDGKEEATVVGSIVAELLECETMLEGAIFPAFNDAEYSSDPEGSMVSTAIVGESSQDLSNTTTRASSVPGQAASINRSEEVPPLELEDHIEQSIEVLPTKEGSTSMPVLPSIPPDTELQKADKMRDGAMSSPSPTKTSFAVL